VIHLPPAALVLLIGASGSGKSTFASRHFDADAVVSSDRLRGLVAGDESDQRATDAAFNRLREWLNARLTAGGLAVVDATNVDWMQRGELIALSHKHGRPAIAIVFNLPLEVCLARNATRSRTVHASVIRRQVAQVTRDIDRLDLEGFAAVHVLGSVADVDAVSLEIEKGPVTGPSRRSVS